MGIHTRAAARSRCTALAAVLALCAAWAAPLSALGADIGIGEITDTSVLQLADAALLTRNTLNHHAAGIQSERYIEWHGGSQLSPLVYASDKLYNGSQTLDAAAAALTARGKEVVAGINGDFFTVSNGVPQGVLVTDGVVRSSGSALGAVGFDPSGGVIIGKPYLNIQLSYNGRTVAVDEINKVRKDTGLYLYTTDFGEDTHTILQGTHILLDMPGELRIGGTLSGTVSAVMTGTEPAPLTEGQMCLSVTQAGPVDRIAGLAAGTAVTVSVAARDPRFTNCPNIIGSYQPLITGGVLESYTEAARAPRTAIGLKADGSAVFYTVDGRQSGYSVGLTLNELAERLKVLGCVEAVNLDGGGSTDIAARLKGETALTRLGKPSDGTPRKCADFLFLVNDSPLTGVYTGLYVKPPQTAVLAGAKIDLNKHRVLAADTNHHMLVSPPGLIWRSDDPSVCAVDENGMMTALTPGAARLGVYAPSGPGAAPLEVTVVAVPDSIRLVNAATQQEVSELALLPGESVELKAVGVYRGADMESDNAIFNWQTTGPEAFVAPNGTLTAGPQYGAGCYLTVSMGGCVLTVPVVIGKAPDVLADFESAAGAPFPAVATGTGFSRDAARGGVQFGRFSGRFQYDFALAGQEQVLFPADIALNSQVSYLSFWLKGDGSGHLLSLALTGADGQLIELPAAVLDGTAYRFYSVPIPGGVVKLSGFKLIYVSESSGAVLGAFHIDQLCAGYAPAQGVPPAQNAAPPSVTFTYQGGLADGLTVAGTVKNVDGGPALRKSNVKVLWDGVEIPFTYDPVSGALSAAHAMPSEGFHRITVEAGSASGGYERVSQNLTQPTAPRPASYTDINGHWSQPFVEFLDRWGAYPQGSDRSFAPDTPITRAEVAVMMARVLKLNLGEWTNISLPYADTAAIPADALPAVKALYGVGVMRGGEVNGVLAFNPGGTFTRVESFVLLANAFPLGMSKPPVAFTYADAADIPAYAADSISLLMNLQIVEGDNNNRIDPRGVITRAGLAKLLCSLF